MKATLVKIEKNWTVIINREDGSCNDYRFSSKKQAVNWAARVGIAI